MRANNTIETPAQCQFWNSLMSQFLIKEVKKAINVLTNSKAPGSDGVPLWNISKRNHKISFVALVF